MSPARGTATPPGPAGQSGGVMAVGAEGLGQRRQGRRDPAGPPRPGPKIPPGHHSPARGPANPSVPPRCQPFRTPPRAPGAREGPPGLLNPPESTSGPSERGRAPLTSPGPERPREPPSPHRRDTPEVPQGRRHCSVPKHAPPVVRPENAAGTLVPEGNRRIPFPTSHRAGVAGGGSPPRVPQRRQEVLKAAWMCSQTLCCAAVLLLWG